MSYSRYWEARGHIGTCIAASRKIAQIATAGW